MDSSRVVFTILWGGGVVFASLVIVVARTMIYMRHKDGRSFRDLGQGFGIGLVAFAAAAAIAAVVVLPEAITLRGFFVAIALGSFFGLLIIMATDSLAQLKRLK